MGLSISTGAKNIFLNYKHLLCDIILRVNIKNNLNVKIIGHLMLLLLSLSCLDSVDCEQL